jgi:hypothetical protein
MCFLALIFNAAQGHSGQNNAKGYTLTLEPKIRKAATYWLSLVFGLHLLGHLH